MLDNPGVPGRESAPAPEVGASRGPSAVGTPIEPAPRAPPVDGRSEWRGTLPEAIRASAERSGVTGFASADWASQPTLRVMAPQELAASVERAHAQVAAGGAQPSVYTVGSDGTIFNTVTNRAEYVPVRAASDGPGRPQPGALDRASGVSWVEEFPESKRTADLTPQFQAGVDRFIGAMTDAGAHVDVDTTYRPRERAYLMHYAWKIGKDGLDPETVPPMAGVNIDWAHRRPDGTVDVAASRAAANAMNDAYKSVREPVLESRHTQQRAIDMSIRWTGSLVVKDASGREVVIDTTPRNGENAQLVEVGKSYGVRKLQGDRPHWSDDGH